MIFHRPVITGYRPTAVPSTPLHKRRACHRVLRSVLPVARSSVVTVEASVRIGAANKTIRRSVISDQPAIALCVECCRAHQATWRAALDNRPHQLQYRSGDHCKPKHSDSVLSVDGYVMYGRDRAGRRGGGVALYVRTSIPSAEWQHPGDDKAFELHWVRVGEVFIAAIYHPPKPIYRTEALLDYIETCVDELNRRFPGAAIVIAGDLNQLPDEDLVERTGLTQIVRQPTRGASVLDRVFVSCPQYNIVRVVRSVVKSDHLVVVAYSEGAPHVQTKTCVQRTFRRKSPTQHALFLRHVSAVDIGDDLPSASTQSEFDNFYNTALGLLGEFYPERTISITSRDPDWVTPEIKAMLRRKNRLMRAGRVEEAGALAYRCLLYTSDAADE